MTTVWFFNLLQAVMAAIITLVFILFFYVLYNIFKNSHKC